MTQQPSALVGSAALPAEPATTTLQPSAPSTAAVQALTSPPTGAVAPVETLPSLTTAADAPEGKKDKKEKKKDKDKKKKDARIRGVETMFRVTYNNHIALSQLADNKANMLISLNGAIISALIVIITPRLESLTWAFAPVMTLVIGCTISLAFAIFGSRPRLSRTPVTLEEVRDNRGNALFFGQFTSMSLEEFQDSMRLLTKDDQLVYDALTRQLYSMGRSLLRKYRYLQIAYAIFFMGVALAAVSHGVLAIGFGIGS